MKYSMTIGNDIAELNCSDGFNIQQLLLVEDMLVKAIETRVQELRQEEGRKLPLNADIDRMYPELTMRTRNILKRNGVSTIEEVLKCTPTDLTQMRYMGKKSLDEIRERFAKYGKFAEEVEN